MGEVCKEKNSESWLSVIWRICNLFMSVFFALATYVQINDPDAGLWMVGYGVPSVLCASIGLNPHVTETLPWRRIADLHVMISSAVVAILGWRLCKERITDILQEEEGRSPVGMLRVSTATAITVFPFVAWLYYYINTELRTNWPSHCKTAI
ncbi:Transmembrane protein 220 [Dissostichus eleginoides]|uniref:Transmembrane protein 220 n=1 Tax=Dissostichus eleginoides TaxID=100907 RepID=A0AAD9B762_DISEL|nr:Transmembrane protein 220 [Dissostichus eleginoides]